MSFPKRIKRGNTTMAAAGDWSSLPAELVGEVAGHLSSYADRVHIREVCAHWRASTSPVSAGLPWIVAGRSPWQIVGPIGGDHTFWLPHGDGDKRLLSPFDPPAGLPYCCGTPRGWLALTDSPQSPTRLVLWEPISKAEILLPPLPAVAQVFLSADPHAPPQGGWMAVASQCVRGYIREQSLLFWRPGDAAWTPQLERQCQRIDAVAFHGGKLYFTHLLWRLYVHDLEAPSWPPPLVRSVFIYPAAQKTCRLLERRLNLRAVHPVACGGRLLLVLLAHGRRGRASAEVYRPEWAATVTKELGERVTDLGEYAIFLGRGDTLALSAKEFPAIRRNCVYLVDHNTSEPVEWATIFDLATNSVEKIPHPGSEVDNDDHLLGYSWFCLKKPLLKQTTMAT